MPDAVPIGKTCSIQECGFDEYWLQNKIVDNPSCLQLGELELVSKERKQSTGGRIDILLKDPEDDSMYEIEVMLGETDETHIIRTIEYWDNEKRRWPQRQHYAVLVAESITRRFFNVIQLLSHSIPIIAIQSNIVESEGKRVLHFSKVMDTYEEPEDEVQTSNEKEDEVQTSNEKHDEEYWQIKSKWTIEAAKSLLEVVKPVFPTALLNFAKNYIAIEVNNNNYMWFFKRSGGKSLMCFWFSKSIFSQAMKLLDEASLSYAHRNQTSINMKIDKQIIEDNAEVLKEIAKLVQQSWGK